MKVQSSDFAVTRNRRWGMGARAYRTLTMGVAGALLMSLVAFLVPATTSVSAAASAKTYKIGVDLTYNNTDFWSAYITYEKSYAKSMHVKLIGPLLSAASASLQNQQIEELVNEGAKAVIVNPETATSLAPAIAYAAKKHVQLISVDTIVGVGHVYMVVRASNLLYGQDACAYIVSQGVKSGYVLNLEGDLTSSNGADRSNAFAACMQQNDPNVTVLNDPTVWNDSTAVSDAQTAITAYGSQLKAIYSQWSSPDTGIIPLLSKANLSPLLISDDGVPFEMCDIAAGTVSASQSQPANLYAEYALQYAVDAARGVKLKAGEKGGGAPTLQNVSYDNDSNLADPIVAPFVTKTPVSLTVTPVDGLSGKAESTAVTNKTLWGNVFGAAHGGVCNAS
jgi:simple sugar transport system substrate-binding protein/ribose transport system substrate-binding protein